MINLLITQKLFTCLREKMLFPQGLVKREFYRGKFHLMFLIAEEFRTRIIDKLLITRDFSYNTGI